MKRIDAATLHAWHGDGTELAILDAREEGEFGRNHLLWAVPCALSRMELRARKVLPRLATRIVCVDEGNGLAERLASYLIGIGATDVAVLDGGAAAWSVAGHVLFSGVNVPSKAFGEWVEHRFQTESVEPLQLKAWLDEGRNLAILDSRTMGEFRVMSIPTATSVPGGELAYRVADLVPDPETLIVVNCAGRTRSIIGAESLRRAGVPNRVLALRNGTMGWNLAGLTCERGSTRRFPPGQPKTAALALKRAAAFAEASGVRTIPLHDLKRFETDPNRTLYTLDVRDGAEFSAGHRPGSVNAPGGQLVQATDEWIAVRNARIALLDDDGVRARMTAAWLRQMGFDEVFVVEGSMAEATETGHEPVPACALPAGIESIAPPVLAPLIGDPGLVVLDVGRSIDFRRGHIPGAHWGVRTRLGALRNTLSGASRVVLTSPDGVLAGLAVAEVSGLTRAPISVLDGGTASWRAAGEKLDADRHRPADDECIDVYLRPYDHNVGQEQAMRAYLSWEIDLLREIARDGTTHFGAV